MGVRYDKITFRAGDSWPAGDGTYLTLTFKQGPDKLHLSPVDLTDATISAFISVERDGTPVVATPVVAKRDQVAYPGQFTFRIPAAESAKLTARSYNYGIVFTWPGDSQLTVLHGIMKVTSD